MYLCCASRSKSRMTYAIKKDKNSGELKPEYTEEEYAIPVLNEISIHVKAASISSVDLDMAFIRPQSYPKLRDSQILGRDFAGVVKDVGDKVTKFKKGDHVYGILSIDDDNGTWAETIVVEEKYVCKIPDGLAFEEAATLPYSSITAYKLLFNTLKVQAGEKILIHDAAVDEGFFALQLAKLKGAYVYASTKQMELADELKKYGADEVGEYWKDGQAAGLKFKYAVDFTYEESCDVGFYRAVKKNSLIAYMNKAKYESIMKDGKIPGCYFTPDPKGEDLERISEIIKADKLQAKVRSKVKFYSLEPLAKEDNYKGLGKRVFVIDEKSASAHSA